MHKGKEYLHRMYQLPLSVPSRRLLMYKLSKISLKCRDLLEMHVESCHSLNVLFIFDIYWVVVVVVQNKATK